MRLKLAGNKAEDVIGVVQNIDTSVIPVGTPCVLKLSGDITDGLGVVLPATGGAVKSGGLHYGVCVTSPSIPVNGYGEVMLFGIVTNAVLTVMTRSASTASWSSSQSWASGVILALDTVNNAFLSASASYTSGPNQVFAVLAQSIGSSTASATATSDSRTVITNAVRVFVRDL